MVTDSYQVPAEIPSSHVKKIIELMESVWYWYQMISFNVLLNRNFADILTKKMHVDGWDVLMSWLCDEYLHIHICKNFQKWFMLVCLCHCCVYMYVICILMFLQAYGSQSWSWISSFSPHLIFLKHYFSLNLELTDSSRLVGQQAGIICVDAILSFSCECVLDDLP